MADDFDDRSSASSPSLYSLDKSVAVLRTELRGFMAEIGRRIDVVDGTVKDSLGKYATKDELKERDESIAEIRGNIRWAVRILVSAFIVALCVTVFKSGLIH